MGDSISWSAADGDQFITYDGSPVAMADTPKRAQTIAAALNAQEDGYSVAAEHYQQQLADVRAEFERQLMTADRRAARAENRLREIEAQFDTQIPEVGRLEIVQAPETLAHRLPGLRLPGSIKVYPAKDGQ